ncbi:MAG: 5-deoxy-glucuronate isomerase [Actinomycetia bacterium]|nr:5-deoxy-glucuronate isomerase [Actinomycetes bacterium]
MLVRHRPEFEEPGYHVVLDGAAHHLARLSLSMVVTRSDGDPVGFANGPEEAALVVLEGAVDVTVDGRTFFAVGGRTSVFEAPGSLVYAPVEAEVTVRSVTPAARVAVCRAKAATRRAPFVVRGEEVAPVLRGGAQWRREVRDLLVANGAGRVDGLVVGETINYPGEWSGWPPHRHQAHRPPEEAAFEELYYYRVDPPQGFGIQVHYGSAWHEDEAYLVRDRDAFAIPDGYHPTVAAGGYRLYYLWFMAGPSGRELVPYEDPAHRWTKAAT